MWTGSGEGGEVWTVSGEGGEGVDGVGKEGRV